MTLVVFDTPIASVFESQDFPIQDVSLMIVDRVSDMVRDYYRDEISPQATLFALSTLRKSEGEMFTAEAAFDRIDGERDFIQLFFEFFLEDAALKVNIDHKFLRKEEIPDENIPPIEDDEDAIANRVESATSVIRLVDNLLS